MWHIRKLSDSDLNDNSASNTILLPENRPPKRLNSILDIIYVTVIHRIPNKHEPTFSIEQNSSNIMPPIMVDKVQSEAVKKMRTVED
jgi:hypothetical protein